MRKEWGSTYSFLRPSVVRCIKGGTLGVKGLDGVFFVGPFPTAATARIPYQEE